MSCNFGDKTQSYSLLDKIKDTNVKLCNFSSFDDTKIKYNIFNKNVYSPIAIINDNEKILNCILFTGSIGVSASYNIYCEQIFEKVENNIIVIGGFSGDLHKNNINNLSYLFTNKKLIFYSRTCNELELYKLIGNMITNNNIVSKYKYGGDIIINNALPNIVINTNKNKNVFILSYYLIQNIKDRYEYINLLKVLAITDRVVLIDEHSDNRVVSFLKDIKYSNEIIKSYNIKIIINALSDARVVLSCRLHGAVLSTILGIPTYIIPSDNNKNDDIFIPDTSKILGSFKFQSFVKQDFMCKIIYYNDLENFVYSSYVINQEIINKYIELCISTECEIINMIK
jgi:hypothetical protein